MFGGQDWAAEFLAKWDGFRADDAVMGRAFPCTVFKGNCACTRGEVTLVVSWICSIASGLLIRVVVVFFAEEDNLAVVVERGGGGGVGL